VKFCNELVTDADAMQVFYREQFNKETTMIAYGAYVESSSKPDLISQYGVQPDDYYLIASRLIPENHGDLIAEAFLRSGSRRRLVIAGGANYDSPFHRKIRSFAGEKVILTGHIDDQEIVKELHCNCFAYLHGHSVGGTNPSLLKAMGYGNCILALDTVFNREVLAGGGLFSPRERDTLAQMIRDGEADPSLVENLRRMGPERIRENYTWEKIAGQYDELFREVASR
jgi:glycosyltransferase involved in cell wall biosynthesis